MPICHVGGNHGLALLAMAYRNSIIMPDNQEHTLNDRVVGYGVVVGAAMLEAAMAVIQNIGFAPSLGGGCVL